MADALASGASVRKDVGVQVPPRAPRVSLKKARRHPPIDVAADSNSIGDQDGQRFHLLVKVKVGNLDSNQLPIADRTD
jgi:hypothetical protein